MIYTFKFQDKIYTIKLEDGKQTEVEIDEKKIPIAFQKFDERFYSILIDGKSIGVGILKKGMKIDVFLNGDLYEFESFSERERQSGSVTISGVQQIKSPMPSRVVKILKNLEEEVKEGDGVIVIEAMKMESELKSPINGKVREIKVKEGSAVESGTVLLVISPEEDFK